MIHTRNCSCAGGGGVGGGVNSINCEVGDAYKDYQFIGKLVIFTTQIASAWRNKYFGSVATL